MAYSSEELDWLEAEWAFHLHGRSAFLSREDYLQLVEWDRQGVPAELVVQAMEVHFHRRSKQARPKTYLALKHLEKDVAKAVKLRTALAKAEEGSKTPQGWERVRAPLKDDPRARRAFECWKALQVSSPSPEHPGYLDHFDEERKALRAFLALASDALGGEKQSLESTLKGRLEEAGIAPDSLVWKRAWDHHWGRMVLETWGVVP